MISNISSNYDSICELFNFSKVEFLSFEKCKEEVRKYKITSRTKYNKIRKNNWPSAPHEVYKNKGWKNWHDFLGKVVRVRVDFLSFKECRKEVRKCKIKNNIEYRKNRKNNWPSAPHEVYKEWQGWHDFLGKEKISFLSFEECRKEVIKCKFKGLVEYKKNRKKNWPSCPYETYKEWQGWHDFLGKVGFLSFEECKKEVRKCEFNGKLEYTKNRKQNWPSTPDEVYKNKGWKNWHDFLGIVGFLSFEECKKEVKKFKFKRSIEYNKNRKQNWPSAPYEVYKNKGWKNWYDFLGKETLQA